MDEIEDQEQILSATNNEATAARFSAHSAHYINDPFCSLFISRNSKQRTVNNTFVDEEQLHKSPLINRGTYVRFTSINSTLLSLSPSQMIILGAGFDTRAFMFPHIRFIEIDLPSVIARKRHIIRKNNMNAENISFVEFDLNAEYNFSTLTSKLRPLIDPKEKITVLVECLFMYLSSASTIKSLIQHISLLAQNEMHWIVFEPVGNDHFIRVMHENLASRGLLRLTIATSPTQMAQEWFDIGEYKAECQQCKSMAELWYDDVCVQEKERLGQIEMLDEVEELNLIFSHYYLFHFIFHNDIVKQTTIL